MRFPGREKNKALIRLHRHRQPMILVNSGHTPLFSSSFFYLSVSSSDTLICLDDCDDIAREQLGLFLAEIFKQMGKAAIQCKVSEYTGSKHLEYIVA